RLDIGPRTLDENGITDVDQNTCRFGADWFAPDIYFRYLDTVERPSGDWNRAGYTHGVVDGRIETAEGIAGRRSGDVYLDLLRRSDCVWRGHGDRTNWAGIARHLERAV